MIAKTGSRTMEVVEMSRLNKALGLALQKLPPEKYVTTILDCDCPDALNRGRLFICKHRLNKVMRIRAKTPLPTDLEYEDIYDSEPLVSEEFLFQNRQQR
jgi:hypothetical protein